ncbi:GerAB/ArcD/ProY family transporter, partial [Bacillus sp. HC-TM]
FFGFEMLLLYYPFIKKARTSQKYAHYANLVTTIVYTYLMILTLAFFSEKQLASAIWAYLSMIKIIQFPFLDIIGKYESLASSLSWFKNIKKFVFGCVPLSIFCSSKEDR